MSRYFLILLFTLTNFALAQSLTDTTVTVLKDSVAVKDSTKKVDIDDVVSASAKDSIIFNLSDKQMFIYNEGKINYKKTSLTGGKIFLDFATNNLEAEGLKTESDTAKNGIIQSPKLSEEGEIYEGFKLKYNFKTKRGFISLAESKNEGSAYKGVKVKKVNEDSYFIENGIYTTCESDTPHTYFAAKEMKVINKDQIIAKWVFMYIAGVPLPIPLPFGVFPASSGRSSGIILPTYGVSPLKGQEFRDFGYYWAINDYFDLKLLGSYYSKGGWGLKSIFNYNKRYSFNGIVSAGYSDELENEKTDPDFKETKEWFISLKHNQDLSPTLNLSANLNFQSSNYFSNNSVNYNEILNNTIYSDASISKRWNDAGVSMNARYSRSHNLSTGDINEILPAISLSKTQFYPFRKSNSSVNKKSWYEYIGLSYNGQLKNKRDTKDGRLKIRGGINHSININASPKISYITISPSISYNEKWYNKRIVKENITVKRKDENGQWYDKDTVVTYDKNEINFLRTFSLSLTASTKLYGILRTESFGVEAFRHTLIPSISYSYSPDFSDERWGYYESYIDEDGIERKYDKFGNEIFGGAPSGGNQVLRFSLGNNFEMKTMKDPTDTTSQAKNIQLLNVNLSSGYNFKADSLKLSDLNVSYRTQIGGSMFSFNGSSVFTFYDVNKSGRKINRYLTNAGKGLMRMVSTNLSLSTTLNPEFFMPDRKTKEKEENPDEGLMKQNYNTNQRIYIEEEPDYKIPWDLSLSLSYSLNRYNPDNEIKRMSANINLGFNLTESMKFRITGQYDFVNKEFLTPNITINKDIHCWEMSFNWKPMGFYRGYRFEIRMKAPQLRDIKYEKSGGIYTGIR